MPKWGKTDITDMEQSADPFVRARAERAIELTKEIKKHMSKKGALGLPPLLERRRTELGIVDQVFDSHAVYDRVLVWQFNLNQSEKFENTSIFKADITEAKEKESCPVGVIVSAGLLALDELRSNGMDLGHIVHFVKLAPYKMPVSTIAGIEQKVIVMRSGDIVTSRDLAASIKAKKVSVKTVETKDPSGHVLKTHVFVDSKGKPWNPALPYIPADQ